MNLFHVHLEPSGYEKYICHHIVFNLKEHTAVIVGGENDGKIIPNCDGVKFIKEVGGIQGSLL